MKRLLALLLCLLYAFSISGCLNIGFGMGDMFAPGGSNAQPTESTDEPTVYSCYELKEENIAADEESQIMYVNNMLMVVFKDGTSQGEIDRVIASVDGTVLEQIDLINQYQIQVPVQDLQSLTRLVAAVEENDSVAFAHYDEVYEDMKCSAVPNDPWNGDVDAEDWTDSDVDGSNWWLEMIEAPGAWKYSDYFSKIKIGIIDSGYEPNHPDLQLHFSAGYDDKMRADDHGTHVAGIIGAEHNKIGISGIVQDKELDCYSISHRFIAETMVYTALVNAVHNGAKVINISQADNSGKVYSQKTIEKRAKDASGYMAKLLSMPATDFIVVQSAGNMTIDAINANLFTSVTPQNCVDWGTQKASAEGICSRILVVASAFSMPEITHPWLYDYSNYGNQVDIAAPGGYLKFGETDPPFDPAHSIYSTVLTENHGGYAALYGTSMAAPMVSGVAALVWSVDPAMSGDVVADIVCGTATGNVYNSTGKVQESYGILNARLAVEEALRRTYGDDFEAGVTPPSQKQPSEATIIDSGECNETISWMLDSEGTLTVYGTGTMPDYGKNGERNQPWNSYFNDIRKVVVSEGIKELGWYNFAWCSNLKEIDISEGLVNLGKGTFGGCYALEKAVLPDSITFMGWDVFYECRSLTEVKLPKNLEHIGYHAFYGCTSLKTVTIPEGVKDIGKNCFRKCSNLESVYFLGQVPDLVFGEFLETHPDFVIYYIQGMKGWTTPTWTAPDGTAYKTAPFTP